MPEDSIDWANLDQGEKILWKGQPRMKSILPALVIGIPLSLVGVGLLIIIGAYLQIQNTSFLVTNQGLYKKTGILSRNVQKIGFDKVQNISFSQGIFGSQFDYGNIEISTAGGQGVEMRFNSINRPREVENIINKNLDHSSESRQTERAQRSSDQVVEELQEIRKLLKSIDQKL
ncbi:MAG: putative membrane protein YdbT with pleckstrin-like domain [Candidatus Nanohaloarchaea archaeon]|jgi:uncharacterized membrane protein YdbT with pleckstrin-like domain